MKITITINLDAKNNNFEEVIQYVAQGLTYVYNFFLRYKNRHGLFMREFKQYYEEIMKNCTIIKSKRIWKDDIGRWKETNYEIDVNKYNIWLLKHAFKISFGELVSD